MRQTEQAWRSHLNRLARPDELADDGGRVGVGEVAARRPAAVGRHGPDVIARVVEQVAVVQPLELIVDRPRLRQRDVGAGGEVEHVEAPRPVAVDELLVADPRAVRRQRRALDVVVDDPRGALAHAALDQIGLAAGASVA